jgi:3',5'-cyclic-AMP phosphodiesterase
MLRRALLKNIACFSTALTIPLDLFSKPLAPGKTLRIAHITDTHIQPHIGAARGFAKCLHHIQNLPNKIDFIINGGDVIMGSKSASDSSIEKQWKLYDSVLKSENNIPIYNCIGNHDIHRNIVNPRTFLCDKKAALEKLSLPRSYYSVDMETWKIIVLDSLHKTESDKGYLGKIDEEQLDWLKRELRTTPDSTHILVVSHIPIVSACVFFDGKNFKNGNWEVPGSWMHSDAEVLTDLFTKHTNVKLAISGHIHLSDKIEYNTVTYCCNGAVSGNWWMGSYKHTKPGYAMLDLHADGSFQNNYIPY